MHSKLPKLDLNVTNRCNLRCRHCAFNSGIEKMPEISLPLLKRLLSETKALGGEKIDITGGEPTLRPDLDGIVCIAKELGYRVELVTNGTLLTTERLRALRALGLDSIAISVDGPSASGHAFVRRTGEREFSTILDNLSYAVEAGLYTKVNTLAHNDNVELIPEIARLCLEKKVSELGIYYFTPVGRGQSGGLTPIEPVRWLKFLREKLSPYGGLLNISLELPLIEKSADMGACGCILEHDPFHMQILPTGDVYPCAILASYHNPIGNIRRRSIAEIWNDEPLWRDYFTRMQRGVFGPGCSGCVRFRAFDLEDYSAGYKFVCPLRKFTIEEVRAISLGSTV